MPLDLDLTTVDSNSMQVTSLPNDQDYPHKGVGLRLGTWQADNITRVQADYGAGKDDGITKIFNFEGTFRLWLSIFPELPGSSFLLPLFTSECSRNICPFAYLLSMIAPYS